MSSAGQDLTELSPQRGRAWWAEEQDQRRQGGSKVADPSPGRGRAWTEAGICTPGSLQKQPASGPPSPSSSFHQQSTHAFARPHALNSGLCDRGSGRHRKRRAGSPTRRTGPCALSVSACGAARSPRREQTPLVILRVNPASLRSSPARPPPNPTRAHPTPT